MLKRYAAVVLGLTLAAAACSKGQPEKPATPPPLAPRDYGEAQRQAFEADRIADDEGHLLESDSTLAGIVLPRGLHATYTFEHEWYMRSRRASLEQLRAYFGPRLMTGKVDRSGMGTVTYVEAQPKDSKERRFVTVRIGPAPGNREESEVFISETPMMPVKRPSEAETRKMLVEKMRYAD